MHIGALACVLGLAAAVAADLAYAEPATSLYERRMERALRQAFPTTHDEWRSRLNPDATMRECTRWHNQPPKAVADRIKKREAARLVLPADGIFIGDWRRGEKVAQSGYGLRFTDKDAAQPNGGNCYACHELSPAEVSFGTLGVSLKGFGVQHKSEADYARIVYEKIFNSQAIVPCSTMPRFGVNGILTTEQIKDVVAYLLDPESPVNKTLDELGRSDKLIDDPTPPTRRPRQ